jgi:glycosyltransferase involved in cell wall biosynthesis
MMNALVSASARFHVTPDNRLWTDNESLEYGFWARYLDVYDNVLLAVRAKVLERPPDNAYAATGPNVIAYPLPYYEGASGFVRWRRAIRRHAAEALQSNLAIHLRLPCAIGQLIASELQEGRPFGVEVVGDPYDIFSRGAFAHPLRALIRRYSVRALQRSCARASAVAYVTSSALQKRYPPGPHAFSTHYSSISLAPSDIAAAPRSYDRLINPLLVSVGTLNVPYKRMDLIVSATSLLRQKGMNARLAIIGDGCLRSNLEKLAVKAGVSESVIFTGHLPKRAVFEWLKRADCFVLASKTEGLPRAMIEAMACALPCIATSVGGVPDLLASEDLIPPNDASALCEKIMEVFGDPKRLERMSERNLAKAHEYEAARLQARRVAFYDYVRQVTEKYIAGGG